MPKPNAATFLTTLLALFVLWRSRRWALPTWILTFGLPSLLYALFGGRTFAFRIRGKTVLVTGASSGLGKAIAIVAAKRGAKAVVIAARRKEKLQSTAKAVEALGARAVILELDITDFEAVEAACERTEKELGAIGLLVNNAGSGAWKHVEETTAEEAAKMMACPYNGAFACTTAFVKSMVEAKEGHVLNVTSAASHGGIRGAVGYATARWAMRGFSRNLQQDLRELGIGVTLLNAAEIVGTEYFSAGKAGAESASKIPDLFQFIGKIPGVNYTTQDTAEAALNAVERGWSQANVPWYLLQPFLILEALAPDAVDLLSRLGSAGLRCTSS